MEKAMPRLNPFGKTREFEQIEKKSFNQFGDFVRHSNSESNGLLAAYARCLNHDIGLSLWASYRCVDHVLASLFILFVKLDPS